MYICSVRNNHLFSIHLIASVNTNNHLVDDSIARYNPNPYDRVLERDLLKMFDPPIECSYVQAAVVAAAVQAAVVAAALMYRLLLLLLLSVNPLWYLCGRIAEGVDRLLLQNVVVAGSRMNAACTLSWGLPRCWYCAKLLYSPGTRPRRR